MVSQSQSAPEESTPTRTEDAPTRDGRGAGNQARIGANGGGGAANPAIPTVPKGGGTWTVTRGDTLSAISRRTYGQANYWPHIHRANPDRVFRNGDLILIGTILELPTIEVPDPGGAPGGGTGGGRPTGGTGTGGPTTPGPTTPGPTTDTPTTAGPTTAGPTTGPTTAPTTGPTLGPDTSVPDVDGGVTPAVEPRRLCTEYGNFVVYPNDYTGPLPQRDPEGEHVTEATYTRLMAERQAEAERQRERTISDIDDLLSYGAFDWAITDGEARRALDLLASLPSSQLRVAIGRINIDRLLDNMPAAARRTSNFAKVVVALGPDRVRPFIQELLSYGLFDWAVTDGDIQTIVDILGQLAPAQQTQLLRSLQATFLSRLARNVSDGVNLSNEGFKTIFDALPDADAPALRHILGERFNLDMESWFFRRWQMKVKSDWDAPGLRRLWTLFEQLPPSHVQDSATLDVFLRQSATDGSGVYYTDLEAGVVSYADVNATGGGFGAINTTDASGTTRDVSLQQNINTFNQVVRHEVGHAVDAAIGASRAGGYVRTAESAGKWATYANADAFVDAIIAAAGGITGHGYANESVYERAMRKAVKDSKDFAPTLAALDSSVADPGAAVRGPVAAVYSLDRWHASKNPWYSNPDRVDVGGRQWQRPYEGGEYASFLKNARTAHGVSGYQFRAPGEWFAEAYATYYSDHDFAGGHPAGTRLRSRDAATATWFDTNVDGGYSLARQTGQDNGGAGGGGGPGGAPGANVAPTAPGGSGGAPGTGTGSPTNQGR